MMKTTSVLESAPARRTRRPPRVDPALLRRRALTLLGMTIVLPGMAQIVAGNRRIGRLALRIWLALLAFVALLVLLGLVWRSAVLSIVTSGWFLTGAQWTAFGFAALWAGLLIDAWRLGRPGAQPVRLRRVLLGLLAVLLLVLPGGLAYAGTNMRAARVTLSTVFHDGAALDAARGRYNILLLGGDSGTGREGTRPDSIQLASVNADTGRTVIFGFSRETENIHFRPDSTMAKLMPQGWTCGDECLLNGLYTWAQDHKDEFPDTVADPGILATVEAVEALSGLDIQYYVLVDLQGFRGMIDAVGGLDINVQRRTPIGGGTSPIFGYIEPGRQHLDGYHALWYARSRTGSTNYERMARQRCVVMALVDQLDPQTMLLRFPSIMAASKGVVRTDIPQSAFADLADLAIRAKQERITSVNFVPPLINPWDYNPRVITHKVRTTIEASDEAASEPTPGTTPQATAPAQSAAPTGAGNPSGTEGSAQPGDGSEGLPPVMVNPGSDPDAATSDLAGVCSVG